MQESSNVILLDFGGGANCYVRGSHWLVPFLEQFFDTRKVFNLQPKNRYGYRSSQVFLFYLAFGKSFFQMKYECKTDAEKKMFERFSNIYSKHIEYYKSLTTSEIQELAQLSAESLTNKVVFQFFREFVVDFESFKDREPDHIYFSKNQTALILRKLFTLNKDSIQDDYVVRFIFHHFDRYRSNLDEVVLLRDDRKLSEINDEKLIKLSSWDSEKKQSYLRDLTEETSKRVKETYPKFFAG